MELIIISGRSGSGKSTAINLLEDEGFFCIDNMPVSLLPGLVKELSQNTVNAYPRVAVCIDARNTREDLTRFDAMCASAREMAALKIVYLDADTSVLIKRFSETRRKHPLSGLQLPLLEAIESEQSILEPIATAADLRIDTSSMNVHSLRAALRDRILNADESKGFSLLIESFGFKGGVPTDADIVFDLRMLPNPHWEESLRPQTGLDQPVKQFLEAATEVQEMFDDIYRFLDRWLPRMQTSGRSYVTVAVGCTGGQHRSVYMAQRLGEALKQAFGNLQIRHRELAAKGFKQTKESETAKHA